MSNFFFFPPQIFKIKILKDFFKIILSCFLRWCPITRILNYICTRLGLKRGQERRKQLLVRMNGVLSDTLLQTHSTCLGCKKVDIVRCIQGGLSPSWIRTKSMDSGGGFQDTIGNEPPSLSMY